MARAGGLNRVRRIAALRAAEPAVTARVMALFDVLDVLLTPGTARGPSKIGAYQRRGALATLNSVIGRVPFQAVFNATGQPAAVVPWGLDGDGLPMSVQLVGRPSDEVTLLSLSAQIEAARPWAARRPAVA
jgi:amidase